MALIPPTFLYVFLRNQDVLASIFCMATNFILQLQLVLLAYNMFTENYVIMFPIGANPQSETTFLPKIDKERFEEFMREKKPYLTSFALPT